MSRAGRPQSITLLLPCFWPEVRRGAERITHELARGLIESGHRAEIVTSHPGLRDLGPGSEMGVPVTRVWRPPDGWFQRRGFESHLSHLPFSYAVLRRHAPDVAHAVNAGDALVAGRYSRHTGRPSVFTYMGIPDSDDLRARRGRRRVVRRAVDDCSAVVALSRLVADAFEESLGLTAEVIYPPVDLEAFSPAPESRDPEPVLFCAADPDEPRKRVELLVAAFARVRRQRPSARLVVLRPRDPERARRLVGEHEGVELLDPVQDPAALAPAYRRAWVSVLPAVYEAFGLVLAESLACGTPVVGTDAGAIPEVIDRGSIGRVFSGGEDELARALLETLELASDSGTAEACRTRAQDFSTRRCIEAYEALYRRL